MLERAKTAMNARKTQTYATVVLAKTTWGATHAAAPLNTRAYIASSSTTIALKALKFAGEVHVSKEIAPLLIRGPSRALAKMAIRRKRDQILAILWRLVQQIPLAVGIPSTAFAM